MAAKKKASAKKTAKKTAKKSTKKAPQPITRNVILNLKCGIADLDSEFLMRVGLLDYNPNVVHPLNDFQPTSPQNYGAGVGAGPSPPSSSGDDQFSVPYNGIGNTLKPKKMLNKNEINLSENCRETGLMVHQENIIKKHLDYVMYEFIGSVKTKKWPMTTDVHCFWCSHPFNTPPVALPEKYVDEVFHLRGCFCSYNCATRYNLESNDYNKWERQSLLIMLYKKLHGVSGVVKITPAPPRETLVMYGGNLEITEFRHCMMANDREYKVLPPPMVAVIPKIEENLNDPGYISTQTHTVVSSNTSLLDNAKRVLKDEIAKAPVVKKNTLESYSNIRAVGDP